MIKIAFLSSPFALFPFPVLTSNRIGPSKKGKRQDGFTDLEVNSKSGQDVDHLVGDAVDANDGGREAQNCKDKVILGGLVMLGSE